MAENVARPAGFEPATPSLEGLRLERRSAENSRFCQCDRENGRGTGGSLGGDSPELHRTAKTRLQQEKVS